MSNESTIQLLHGGFIVCLVLSIICAITAVAIFFLFDIRLNYAIRSGKLKQKKIKEMQRINAMTGSLNYQPLNFNFTDEINKTDSNASAEIKYNPPVSNGNTSNINISQNNNVSAAQTETTLLENSYGTMLLSDVEQNISVNSKYAETSVLSNEMLPAEKADKGGFAFKVTECILLIHTNDII